MGKGPDTGHTSSSYESDLSSNRIFRPPSEFGDHRDWSDAECDQVQGGLVDPPSRAVGLQGRHRRESVDSRAISNELYGQTTDEGSTHGVSESDRSNYSITV